MTKRLQKILHSSAFYSKPSWQKGSARLMDLFGQMDEFNIKPAEQENKEALERDWKMVGRDLKGAIQTYEEQTGHKKTTQEK